MIREAMANAGLTIWPILGLLCFLLAFVGIAAMLWLRRDRQWNDRMRHLPLEDDVPLETTEGGKS